MAALLREAMKVPISNRLLLCAEFVPRGSRAADIGTDHGYLSIYLLREGICPFVTAADLREQPLQKARENAARFGVSEKMRFFLSDGLQGIPPDAADTIIMAGMGGDLMVRILEAAPWVCDDRYTLILQPQTKIDLLRCWLCGHGYRFLSETHVRDKEQLYVVFRVRAGTGQELSEADALTGLLLRSDPLYGEYLSQHLIKLNRARDGLAVSSLADKEARIAHLENLIEEIERRKGEWEHGNGT